MGPRSNLVTPRSQVAMKSLAQIEADVCSMASTIAAPAQALPTFGRSRDGAHPHIEVSAGAYHHVVVERGIELERRSTTDYQELLCWVFADVTHQMAFEFELHHRVEGQDARRLAFRRQLELMALLGPVFEDRARRNIERILRKAPYRDDPGRSGGSA